MLFIKNAVGKLHTSQITLRQLKLSCGQNIVFISLSRRSSYFHRYLQ